MAKFYNLSDDTIQRFKEIYDSKAISVNLSLVYVGSETQKNLIKISKMADPYHFAFNKDLLISINEDLLQVFDEESVAILFEQEIDKISINIDTGKVKLVKPDLSTFSGLVTKWGIKKICRANKIEDLVATEKETL